jgi:hypothetical protein
MIMLQIDVAMIVSHSKSHIVPPAAMLMSHSGVQTKVYIREASRSVGNDSNQLELKKPLSLSCLI